MSASATASRRRLRDVRSPRSIVLWLGVLLPPAAWGIQLVMGDLLFELGCAPGVEERDLAGASLDTWIVLLTVAVAAATGVVGVLALRAWRTLRAERDGTELDRARAMALMGVASAALYLPLILFGLFPPFLLGTCEPLL